MIAYKEVDIRLAVGQPYSSGEAPIKIVCPMHAERIGSEDDKGSLAVYRKNIHCFGCGYHLKRRYSSLAFLLGEWDGRGDENGDAAREAVMRVKSRLADFKDGEDGIGPRRWVAPEPTEIEVRAFSRYLMKYKRGRLRDELQRKRGMTIETIKQYKLGHTGTHFTIPVPNMEGGYYTFRYRADEEVTDTNAPDFRKYDGQFGRNDPVLFPLPVIRDVSELEELWIVEGEYDAIASNQAGNTTLTITNGATNIAKIYKMIRDSFPNLVVKRWVISTDQDAAGDAAALALAEVLSESGQKWVRARWEGAKDLTEYYALGRREITYDRAC